MINSKNPFECSRCDHVIRTGDLTYLAYDGMVCVYCQNEMLPKRDIHTFRGGEA